MATLADDIRKVLPPWPSWLPPLPSWIPIAKSGPGTTTPPINIGTPAPNPINVSVPITTINPTPINVTQPVSAPYPATVPTPQLPTTPVVPVTPTTPTSPLAPVIPGATYTLQLVVTPAGSGTITATPNQTSYTLGQVVNLTETPAQGYTFIGWGGTSAATYLNPSISVTIMGNTQVSASFSKVVATAQQLATYKAAGQALLAAQNAYNSFENQWYENATADLPAKPASLASVSWTDIAEVYMVLNMGQPYNPVYTSGVTLTAAQIADCMTAGAAYVQWRRHYDYAEFWGSTQAQLDQQLAALQAALNTANANYTAALNALPPGQVPLDVY